MEDIAPILNHTMSPTISIIFVLCLIFLALGCFAVMKGSLGGFVIIVVAGMAIAFPAVINSNQIQEKCETVAKLFEAGKAERNKTNMTLYLDSCGMKKYIEVFDIRLKQK